MKIKFIGLSLLASFFLFTSPVFAEDSRSVGSQSKRGLTEARLRTCEVKEKVLKNRMESLVRLVTNIEEKFDAIAKRVEDFYTNKVLPTGKVVSNYDSLVADIASKKAILQTDLASAQNNLNLFNCSGEDPKGVLTQFRTDMQKVKTDLKNYRTSIKNLIVAVHRVAPTPVPTPTSTP